jgi:hypothetical protein
LGSFVRKLLECAFSHLVKTRLYQFPAAAVKGLSSTDANRVFHPLLYEMTITVGLSVEPAEFLRPSEDEWRRSGLSPEEGA